jgi:FkbM family methyltransferase
LADLRSRLPTLSTKNMVILELAYKKVISGLDSKQFLIRFGSRFFFQLIQRIVRYYDPLITYQISSQYLQMPLSHALPIVRQRHPDYSQNLARLASCIQTKYPDLKVIDIGANIGDSVFIIRNKVSCPILCIEGDPVFFKILQTNTADCKDLVIKQVFIGDNDVIANKELVVVSGTAHFIDSSNSTEFKKLSSVLHEESQFSQAKLLKIDTDGFDLAIIRGSIDFIESAKPILFFEYDPFFLRNQKEDGISIFSLLQALGYHSIVIYDNFGRYLISLTLTETNQIADMHGYLLNRLGDYYYDICAVQAADLDIIQQLREIELSLTKIN